MSRIPVFIEKKNRKKWNKTAETCIFISCESNTTNTSEFDFEDSEEPGHYDLNNVKADTLLENFPSKPKRVRNVSVSSDDEYSVKGIKYDSDFINGDDRHSDVSNTSISLTVVSCNKGIVNATCNCKLCQSVGDQLVVTSTDSCIEVGGKPLCKTEIGTGNDLIKEFGKVTKTRSLIPKLTPRLTAGIVSVTPAPVKGSKRRKNCHAEVKTEAPTESDSRTSKNPLQNFDKEFISVQQTTGVDDREEMRNDIHSLPNELGFDTEKKIRETVIGKKVLTDEAFVVKSFHDLEDSEPECAQHEHKMKHIFKGREISTNKQILHRVELEDLESNTEEVEIGAADFVLSNDNKEAVRSPSSSHYSVNLKKAEGKFDSVAALPRKRSVSNERSPIRSQIPVLTCPSPKQTSGTSSPVRSSPSMSRESSQSPVRNTFTTVESSTSKLPPKSPVYSQGSPLVTKRRFSSTRSNTASPHCVLVKSPNLRNAAEQVSPSLTKLTTLAQKQIKLLKSNNHIKDTVKEKSPDENVPISSASKPVLNKHSNLQAQNTDCSFKRNLPKAPEKRILRYGQRCMTRESYQLTGYIVALTALKLKHTHWFCRA